MLIKVKVFSESKKDGIVKKSDDSFEIKVKAKPERGEANKAVINMLAGYFEIPTGKIRMIKGSKQRSKIFEIMLK